MPLSTFFLQDANGQNWQISITTVGNLQATPVTTTGTTPGIVPLGTLTPQDAIDMAKAMNHKIPTLPIQAYVCNQINAMIWTSAPWNWTQTALTGITLVDGTQDYAHSQTDLYRIVNLRLARTDLSPVKYTELNQRNHLGVELERKAGIDGIRNFSYEGGIAKLRLDYAATVSGTTVLQLQGEYQRVPTSIAQGNLNSPLIQPDHYFNVFLSGMRWMFYNLADDPRAGSASEITVGRKSYSGQLGEFMSFLDAMKQAEDFSDGEDLNFPSESYGDNTQGGGWGIFPG